MCKLWVEHIAATQVHKFIQATPPFNTISTIGSAIGDLVLIPANEYKKTRTKSALGRGFKKGFKQFGKNVAVEGAVSLHKATKYVANKAAVKLGKSESVKLNTEVADLSEARGAAIKGLKEARHSITMMPRVSEKRGSYEAAKLIPIAMIQSVGGVSEATSVSCLAFRNSI